MVSRIMDSGRFAYAMGYESRAAAQDAFDSMCNQGEMSPCEGKLESYNAGRSPHQIKTRWAVTVKP